MAKLFLESPQELMPVLKKIAVVWESSSVGENELQECIVDESALYDMTKYIPTHFEPQASAIEIYYRIQSKIHKAEETARL
jgi:hypothetical protein